MIGRISGSNRGHQGLQTFEFAAISSVQCPHLGWGCLWSFFFWKPIYIFLTVRSPGLWRWTGRLQKSGLCDHHPSHGHWGPCQLIAPSQEVEPLLGACIIAVHGWINSGGNPFTYRDCCPLCSVPWLWPSSCVWRSVPGARGPWMTWHWCRQEIFIVRCLN